MSIVLGRVLRYHHVDSHVTLRLRITLGRILSSQIHLHSISNHFQVTIVPSNCRNDCFGASLQGPHGAAKLKVVDTVCWAALQSNSNLSALGVKPKSAQASTALTHIQSVC
jgi:hypothetical protein